MRRVWNSLQPTFLRNLDRKLLLNYPNLWATRIHWVMFWGTAALLAAAAYAFLLPNASALRTNPVSGAYALMVPVLVGFFFWLRELSAVSVWGENGRFSGGQRATNMLAFLLGTAIFSAIPLVYYLILGDRLEAMSGESWQFGDSLSSRYHHYELKATFQIWLVVLLPIFWLGVEVFAYIKWQQFFGAFFVAFAILIFVILFSGLGSSLNMDGLTQIALVFMLPLGTVLLVMNGYQDSPVKQLGISWRVVSLIIATFLILLLPTIFLFIDMKDHVFSSSAWSIGVALSILSWHLFFRKRVMNLQSSPKL